MTGNKSTHGPNVNYYYDYIEIYNMSGQAVNLKGYGLSDNIKKPRKWQFPDITIENNSYLVIYCDTTQTSKDGVYYFTNFNLKKSGETVCLSTPSGQILDKVVVPQLYDDTSYGRTLGQAGLFYYSTPTPGETNGQGFVGYAEAPTFNVVGGLYERPLTGENAVTINVPANSTVRYTLDSTDPNESSPVYAGPIEVETNTVIRRARLSRRRGSLADYLRNVSDFRVPHDAGHLPDDRSGQSDQRGLRRVRLWSECGYLPADPVDQDCNLRPEELVQRLGGIQR